MNDKEFTDLKVLLIEPSNTQQVIIKQFLIDLGISDITTVETGQQTLAQLKTSPPDLIISAMYLSDMTGVDLLQQVRDHDESFNTAFLLISSETNIRYLDPIRQAGAIAILPKPFSRSDLDKALSATIDYLNPKRIELNHLDVDDVSVLVVDDSALSLKYISKILNDIGIEQIDQAINGKEALNLINQRFYDLIVTDYNMPEMDGLELALSIRAESNQKTIPIIMVTSEKNQSRLAAVNDAGFSAVLDKPFDPDSIRNMIAQILN